MRIFAFTAFALALMGASTTLAAEDGHFTLEKVEGGYVRLNTVTGEVSFCEEKAGQFVCRVSPSERAAYENQINELQKRLDLVEERVALLESRKFDSEQSLTSEEEFEKTLGFMEKFFRRFMDIVKDFDRDFGGGEKAPGPEKT